LVLQLLLLGYLWKATSTSALLLDTLRSLLIQQSRGQTARFE
jgi:hypothetical protein